MWRYTLRRLVGGIPILFGVLVVTFILFHCGAGDPAAVMLGLKATPREIENLRSELKLDRPLLYGHWRRTEIIRGHDFGKGNGDWATAAAATISAGVASVKPGGSIDLKRGWDAPADTRVRLVLESRGDLTVGDAAFTSRRWQRHILEFARGVPATLTFKAGAGGAEVRGYHADSWQANAWDSQFLAAIREVVDIRRDPQSGGVTVSVLNFGRTLLTREPINQVLWDGLGPSLALALPVFGLELVLAILIALSSAYWRDSWLDRSLVLFSVAGMSISYLVYIIVGQYVLAYRWNWFPVWGFESWRYLVLPAMVGVLSGLGSSVRFYRTVFLNEMYRDHIRTARAKGCGPWRILLRHVLPNAMIPVITRIAVVLPFLYTGSLLLESFFGIPGLGYAGVNALANADLQLLKALVLIGALMFIVANILADLGNAWADPRVRLK